MLKPMKCIRCDRTLTAQFQLGKTCRNTEACKRRAAKLKSTVANTSDVMSQGETVKHPCDKCDLENSNWEWSNFCPACRNDYHAKIERERERTNDDNETFWKERPQ